MPRSIPGKQPEAPKPQPPQKDIGGDLSEMFDSETEDNQSRSSDHGE